MKQTIRSRREALESHLQNAILTLALAPGDDLDETELAEAFGLSRTPLREVLRELAGQGYLELRLGRGARVANLNYDTLRNFFLAAPLIYTSVARLAAMHAKPEQLEMLRACQARFVKSLAQADPAARTLANAAFHRELGLMAANPYLLPSLERLLIDHARIGMRFYAPLTPDMEAKQAVAVDQHEQLIDAVARRDAEQAVRVAEAHWQLSRDEIALYATPSALDVPTSTLDWEAAA